MPELDPYANTELEPISDLLVAVWWCGHWCDFLWCESREEDLALQRFPGVGRDLA